MISPARVRAASAAALATSLILATATTVLAHAELTTSMPADGAVLGVPPSAVVATYSEAIDPARSSLVVLDASGAEVAHGGVDPTDTTNKTMKVPLAALSSGRYTVRWTTVTSDDNGVERGTFSFTVAAASPSPSLADVASPPPASGTSSTSGADTLLPIVVAVGVLAVIGGLFAARRRTS